jgi:hypothetical protein
MIHPLRTHQIKNTFHFSVWNQAKETTVMECLHIVTAFGISFSLGIILQLPK